jgi:tryptophanyl-tRNA synthetase
MALPRPPRKPRAKSPSDIRQANIGRDTAEERHSAIPFGWEVFREFYDPQIIAAAERLFDDASLNIQTVMMVQVADVFRVRRVLMEVGQDDDRYLQLERLAAAQLRHLRLMAERFGANASADTQMVQVPIGLELDLSDPRIFGDSNLVN